MAQRTPAFLRRGPQHAFTRAQISSKKIQVYSRLRPVNGFTTKHLFPMPNIEQEQITTAGSAVYANFDMSYGYWQLPLHVSSQASQSFITPDEIYSTTRVMHGSTIAVLYLQSTMSGKLPETLCVVVLWWLNDIILHARSVEDHL